MTRWPVWSAGAVVLGAIAATAHGLFEVAVGCRVPSGIAWLYPVITDGLALVAYAATTRLRTSGQAYAWAVVVLGAGLSGLGQATYLAGFESAPTGLRFGVGAWPAVAGAIAAHLLYLLGRADVSMSESKRQSEILVPTSGPKVQSETPVRNSPAPPKPKRVSVPAPTDRNVAETKAAALLASGAGRRRISRELGISEYEARVLLEQHAAEKTPTNGVKVLEDAK